MSLRLKSYLVYAALIAYAIFLSAFILYQKQLLFNQFDDLQKVYDSENLLQELDVTIFRALKVQGLEGSEQGTDAKGQGAVSAQDHLRDLLGLAQDFYARNTAGFDNAGPVVGPFKAALASASAAPTWRNVTELYRELSRLKVRLEQAHADNREQRDLMFKEFRLRSDTATITALLLGLLGLTMLGTINALFFRRLTRDVQTLRQRAGEIVEGRRGDVLPVTRNDEVGELIESINHMAGELQAHEEALELERHKQFHQEKMAAIGTLAAGIAHEVGNPIAAICALVEEIKQANTGGGNPHAEEGDVRKLDMVLRQAERLRGVAQEISGFARPRSNEHELLDLNGLIRSTCRLMRYDARWKNVELLLELDNELPAISAVGDQLTQVVMNLLVNAVDALEGLEGRTPAITVATVPTEDGICMSVRDNGCGMDRETARHAVDTFFTTKAAGKGTGLGLSLCQSIVAAHRGRLELDSTLNRGTMVRVLLPLDEQHDD